MPFLLKEYSHGGDGAGPLANPGNCSPAMRGLNGYRFYNDEAVKMLLFVGRAQALGQCLNQRPCPRAIPVSPEPPWVLDCAPCGRHLSKVRTGFARSRPSRSCCIYGCDTLRCSCCLRHPYGVMPRGLYTDSVVVTSNTSRPPPAWRSSPRNPPRLALSVSAATPAK